MADPGCNETDRLSSLPDTLILEILSHLDTKLALQTSILSKRFNHLWTFLNNLTFNSHSFTKMSSFDKFITHVFDHHDVRFKVHSLSYARTGTGVKPINRILNYIAVNPIDHLSISGFIGKNKKFVPRVLLCRTLKTLHLQCMRTSFICDMLSLPRKFSLPCLTTLVIENLVFQKNKGGGGGDGVCLVSFGGCPNLKSITLVHCVVYYDWDLKVVRLVCPCVENLVLHIDNGYVSSWVKVVLTAPKLRNFSFSSYFPIGLCLYGCSCLEVVEIGGRIVPSYRSQDHQVACSVIDMLQKFSIAKVVTISCHDLVLVRSRLSMLI